MRLNTSVVGGTHNDGVTGVNEFLLLKIKATPVKFEPRRHEVTKEHEEIFFVVFLLAFLPLWF